MLSYVIKFCCKVPLKCLLTEITAFCSSERGQPLLSETLCSRMSCSCPNGKRWMGHLQHLRDVPSLSPERRALGWSCSCRKRLSSHPLVQHWSLLLTPPTSWRGPQLSSSTAAAGGTWPASRLAGSLRVFRTSVFTVEQWAHRAVWEE